MNRKEGTLIFLINLDTSIDAQKAALFQNNSEVTAVLHHFRSYNCQEFKIFEYFFLAIMAGYTSIMAYWMLTSLRSQSGFHRILLILPLVKLIETGSLHFFITECPWTNKALYIYITLLRS
mmetsp:Transcript_16338/g.16060  ORF Transcript_16338/g.16060 Transcript_16338/m.16060 type:complete len:121 (+) Transcript_16338:320-682(+)